MLIALTLAVAGATHAVSLLLLPWRSHHDAYTRVTALAPLGTKVILPEPGTPRDSIPFRDAAFITAVCRYDLRVQPFRLSLSPFDSGFVTLGFHTRHGIGFYGLNVRATDATRLDLALVNKGAGQGGRRDTGQYVIAVETPEPDGFVLVATPADDDTDRPEALARLDAIQCGRD